LHSTPKIWRALVQSIKWAADAASLEEVLQRAALPLHERVDANFV
jgi:hypothetical protein